MTHRELEQALAKLNTRLRKVEKELHKPPTRRRAVLRGDEEGQPITLYGGFPADAQTPAGKPRYLPPHTLHTPLPPEMPAIRTKPTAVKTICRLVKVESWKVSEAYRKAGYTIMRSDNTYTNQGGYIHHPLFILPLKHKHSKRRPKAGA